MTVGGTTLYMSKKVKNHFYGKYRIWWHILFWVAYVIYEGLIWGMVDDTYELRFYISMVELPVKVTATYFTIYVLIDKYLIKKKYQEFIIFLIISMFFFGIALRFTAFNFTYPKYYPESLNLPFFWPPKLLISMFYIYAVVAFVSVFHLAKIWYLHQLHTQQLLQKSEELEKEKIAAELKLLKSQINPHFLFNTLNNLYSLTLKNSSKAPEMVHKLSELMSYMLYESNHPEVSIEKEIRYLENYISLEKLRYDGRLDVQLKTNLENSGIRIAPLVLLPFVENSFKHGVSNQISGGWIQIEISIKNSQLTFKVENSKSDPTNKKEENGQPCLGLENLRKRLSLIYPDKHEIRIMEEKDSYLVILKIDLPATVVSIEKEKVEQV